MFGNDLTLKTSTNDRYCTMAKYADHHINSVLDFLKTTNNTIVVIVGDHGARKFVPQLNSVVDFRDESSPMFDQSCFYKAYSNDNMFDASGLITYFGEDPKMKEIF